MKSKASINQAVEALLAQMTLAEKIGQMNQYNGFWEITGPTGPAQILSPEMKLEHLKKGHIGSLLNVRGVKQVRKLQEIAVNDTRLGIPLIFGFDIIHGHKTLSPIPLAESASWDLEAIEKSARVAAIEASALGINWTFAPMVDISRDARWGRVMEGAGEDPFLGSAIGVARVRGFQGQDLSEPDTIAACAKHFAAYGFAEAGKDYNTVDIGTVTLHNVVLPPFKAAVNAGVRTLMNGFNVLNSRPVTGNSYLQRDLLKGEWGFKGFIVSDWASTAEMVVHGYAEDLAQAAALAANAGSDMDMESYAYVPHLEQAVRDGQVAEDVIDDAVRRILRVKFELGLFDDPYRYCDTEREQTLIYHKGHHAAALDMAKKSIVLLKNESDILPLSKTQQKIAIIGPLAADKTSPLGSWRIGSDDETAISVLEGISQYTNAYEYTKGVDLIRSDPDFIRELLINETDNTGIDEACQLAANARVVIMVLGEHGFQSGEGRCRTDLNLPGLQLDLLKKVQAVNSNIILVLMNGRPLTINWEAENIPAILECWQLGTQSGNAIAATLFGDSNPGGKLPMTFPRSIGQIPIYYNHLNTGRPTPEQEVFWSHYIDEENSPLFPFGFGLSYTKFTYANLIVNESDKAAIKVSVEVTNSGNRKGEEVVQLYIRDRVASIARPVKELKGFQKIELEVGEMQVVKFILTNDELGFFNEKGEFLVEPGTFDVMLGGNSQDLLEDQFIV